MRAEPGYYSVAVFDPIRVAKDNVWPLPDAVERKRYHTEQAALAEQEKQWFAVAFHLGWLLMDAPADGDLRQRRDEALQKQQAAQKPGIGTIPLAKWMIEALSGHE